MFLSALVALALLAHSASAQNNTTSIDPGSVDIITRCEWLPIWLRVRAPEADYFLNPATWCPSQKNICVTLCNQCAQMNTCFPVSLHSSPINDRPGTYFCPARTRLPGTALVVTRVLHLTWPHTSVLCHIGFARSHGSNVTKTTRITNRAKLLARRTSWTIAAVKTFRTMFLQAQLQACLRLLLLLP